MFKLNIKEWKALFVKQRIVLFLCLTTFFLGYQTDRRMGFLSSDKGNDNVLSDGTGYYAYLPQYIIYPNQPQFQFSKQINKKYPEKNYFSMLEFTSKKHHYYNKFYVGTAICQAPLFFITHHLTKFFNPGIADGYSLPYRGSIALTGLLFYFLGMLALFGFFKLKQYKTKYFFLIALLLTFGTNLNYYVSYYTSYSHIYSFSFVCLFLYFGQKWANNDDRKSLFKFSLILGIIIIIRPVNGLFLIFTPFFFHDLNAFWLRVKSLCSHQKMRLFSAILFLGVPIVFQLFVTYHQTGHFAFYNYTTEGFSNWQHPEIFKVLFSYEKGFFVYAPAMLLILPATLYFIIKNKFLGLGIFSFSMLFIYFISSWWCWNYGGGLGMRAMVELLPILSIPLMFTFNNINLGMKSLFVLFGISGIIIYQIFQIQYNKNILHYEKITKAQFWRYFLRTEDRFSWAMAVPEDQIDLKSYKHVANYPFGFNKLNFTDPANFYTSFKINPHNAEQVYILKSKIKITKEDSNPFVKMKIYEKGNSVEKNYYLGNQIENIERFEKMQIKINPYLYAKQIDSIDFQVLAGNLPTYFKDFKLELYKKIK